MRFQLHWKKIIAIVLPVLVVLLGCFLFIRYQQGRYDYTTAKVTKVYNDTFICAATYQLHDGTSESREYAVHSRQCKKVQNHKGHSIHFSDIGVGDKVTIKSTKHVLASDPYQFEKIYLITLEDK